MLLSWDAAMGYLYTAQAASYNQRAGEVLELADRRDLGSRAGRREGSNPSFPIRFPFHSRNLRPVRLAWVSQHSGGLVLRRKGNVLKVKTKSLDDCQVELTVEIPVEEFSGAMRAAARRLSKDTRIPGFRPGKAPYDVILRRFGEEAVFEEALDTFGQHAYRQALEEAKLEPFAQGSLDEVVSKEPLVLRYTVPLEPEIDLGKYRKVRLPFHEPKAEDQAVDDLMEELRQSQALIEPVSRPAQMSDVVVLDAQANLAEEDGNASSLLKEDGVSILVADETSWPIPGIAAHLVGISAGEEKEFSYTFPDDYSNEDMRGKQADFHLKCHEVKSRIVPQWSDELARNIGDFKDLLELRIKVRERLQQEALKRAEGEYAEQVIDAMVDQAKVVYPPVLIEREIDSLVEDLRERLKTQKLGLEDYLKIEKKSEEQLRADLKPVAHRRLLRGLVLGKLVEEEKLELTDEDIEDEVQRLAAPFGDNATSVRKVFESPAGRQRIQTDLLTEKAIRRLMEIARGQDGTEKEKAKESSPKQAKAGSQKTKRTKKEKA
jgi:trigger factor